MESTYRSKQRAIYRVRPTRINIFGAVLEMSRKYFSQVWTFCGRYRGQIQA